jgi:hypothetical protein
MAVRIRAPAWINWEDLVSDFPYPLRQWLENSTIQYLDHTDEVLVFSVGNEQKLQEAFDDKTNVSLFSEEIWKLNFQDTQFSTISVRCHGSSRELVSGLWGPASSG